jgi:hypothetical protein
MSSKIEDLIYSQALKENGLNKSGDNLWSKKEAILWYQNKCERVIKNLDYRECNWQKIFSDNDANHMLQQLTKDDDKFKNTKKRQSSMNEKFGVRQTKQKFQRNQSINKISSITNLNSSTESGLSLKIKNNNNNINDNKSFLPIQPSFYGFQNVNDSKVLSNDILDVGIIGGDGMYCDDYDLGFNFDDDNSNIPESSTKTIVMQETLQQQRDRERQQRLAEIQTVEIDNNMLDLIMDI